jgi:hypothetical protein
LTTKADVTKKEVAMRKHCRLIYLLSISLVSVFSAWFRSNQDIYKAEVFKSGISRDFWSLMPFAIIPTFIVITLVWALTAQTRVTPRWLASRTVGILGLLLLMCYEVSKLITKGALSSSSTEGYACFNIIVASPILVSIIVSGLIVRRPDKDKVSARTVGASPQLFDQDDDQGCIP